MATFDTVDGTVCNATQYSQSQAFGDGNLTGPSISCLTRGQSIGLTVAAEASLISSISIILIFIRIGWNVRWYRRRFPNGDWRLFRVPADIYMFSLFVFDLLQSIGGNLNIRWVRNGIVTNGSFCTAQGVIEQIGDLGVALTSLFLAVHTFVAAVWYVGLNARGIALSLVCLACIFITLWVVIGPTIHKNYETPTPYWCWISSHYTKERLAGEYVWMWIALFASAMLYIPLYFWAQGFWSVDEGFKFHWRNPDQRVEYAGRRAALGMSLYPLGYSVVVVPLSIARWLQFNRHHVSSAATFFTVSLFYLSGAINVLLFLTIRPGLLLFPRPRPLDDDDPEMELAPPQGSGPANSRVIFSGPANMYRTPKPSLVSLGDGDFKDNATEISEDDI